MLVTRPQYGRYRRCTRQAVTKAIQAGKIRLTPGGKIDTDDADARWPLTCEPDLSALGNDGAEVSREEAERRKVLAQAQLAELQLAKEKGALLDAAEVNREWFDCARALRNAIQQACTTAAPECVGKDVIAVEAILRRHMDGALAAEADRLAAMGRAKDAADERV